MCDFNKDVIRSARDVCNVLLSDMTTGMQRETMLDMMEMAAEAIGEAIGQIHLADRIKQNEYANPEMRDAPLPPQQLFVQAMET